MSRKQLMALLALRVTAARVAREEAAALRDAARHAYYQVPSDETEAEVDAHSAWCGARDLYDLATAVYIRALEEQSRALVGIVGVDLGEQLESLRRLVGEVPPC